MPTARSTTTSPPPLLSAGFYLLKDTKSTPSAIHREAVTLLESLHVQLNALSNSRDRRETTQRAAEASAARHTRAALVFEQYIERHSILGDTDSADRGPPPAFCFTPLSTSPSNTLVVVEADAQRQTRRAPLERSTTVVDTSVAAATTSTLPPREEDKPMWNASTVPCRVREEGDKGTVRVVYVSDDDAGEEGDDVGSEAEPTVQQPHRAMRRPRPLPTVNLRRSVDTSLCASVQETEARAEREAAVRDYLRRINVLSRDTSDVTDALEDALYNGTALCQLSHIVATMGCGDIKEEHNETDVVPRRAPRTLEDVNCNYTCALATLSEYIACSAPSLQLPPRAFSLSAETAITSGGGAVVLIDLYVALISQCLPPLETLVVTANHSPSSSLARLVWQTPADVSTFSIVSDWTALQATERRVCEFLFRHGALPDPTEHALPSDMCLVPPPLEAPFLAPPAPRKLFAARKTPPATLYIPSVFPYLRNGVALCALAAALAEPPAVSANPRTRAASLQNIRVALRCLAELTEAPVSLALRTAECAEAFYCGDRVHIVRALGAVARAWMPRRIDPIVEEAPSNSAITPHTLSPPPPPPPHPLLRRSASARVETRSESVKHADVDTTISLDLSDRESVQLQQWLAQTLGASFCYQAEDESFTYIASNADTLPLLPQGGVAPACLVFSDGVVLAHLVRELEQQRCVSLEGVRPTCRGAAKRFNIRRCLAYLQTNKKIVFGLPLLEERLLKGDPAAVACVLRALRKVYKRHTSSSPHAAISR